MTQLATAALEIVAQRRQFANRHRLGWKTRSIGFDGGDGRPASLRKYFCGAGAAHPALARAHAATGERLELVEAETPLFCRLADLAGGDLLATADQRGIVQHRRTRRI